LYRIGFGSIVASNQGNFDSRLSAKCTEKVEVTKRGRGKAEGHWVESKQSFR
jgi:hypothetical protein